MAAYLRVDDVNIYTKAQPARFAFQTLTNGVRFRVGDDRDTWWVKESADTARIVQFHRHSGWTDGQIVPFRSHDSVVTEFWDNEWMKQVAKEVVEAREKRAAQKKLDEERAVLRKWGQEAKREWKVGRSMKILDYTTNKESKKMKRNEVKVGQTFKYAGQTVSPWDSAYYGGVLKAVSRGNGSTTPLDARLVNGAFVPLLNRWSDTAEVELVPDPTVPPRQSFFLVWSPEAKQPPTRKIGTEAQALAVAAKMAEEHGGTFHVLEERAAFTVVEEEKTIVQKVKTVRKS